MTGYTLYHMIVIQLYIDDTSYDTPIIYDTSFDIQPDNNDQ